MRTSKISDTKAIFSTFVSTLGCGITFMPQVFNISKNPLMGLLIMGSIGLVMYYSLYALAYAADKMKLYDDEKLTYEQLASRYSEILRHTVSLSLIFSNLANSFSFIQILFQLLIQTVKFNLKAQDFIDNLSPLKLFFIRSAMSIALASAVSPFLRMKDLSSLWFCSYLSLFCSFAFIIAIFAFGSLFPIDDSYVDSSASLKSLSLGSIIGIVSQALYCQFSYLDVYSLMENQKFSNVAKVNAISSFLATGLYSLVGYMGRRAFGYLVETNSVIISFGNKDCHLYEYWDTRFANSFVSYIPRIIMASFIPIFFCAIIFGQFAIIPNLSQYFMLTGVSRPKNIAALFSFIFIVICGLIEVKDSGKLLGIIGFMLTIPLSFIFPAIFCVKSMKDVSLLYFISQIVQYGGYMVIIYLFIDTLRS